MALLMFHFLQINLAEPDPKPTDEELAQSAQSTHSADDSDSAQKTKETAANAAAVWSPTPPSSSESPKQPRPKPRKKSSFGGLLCCLGGNSDDDDGVHRTSLSISLRKFHHNSESLCPEAMLGFLAVNVLCPTCYV